MRSPGFCQTLLAETIPEHPPKQRARALRPKEQYALVHTSVFSSTASMRFCTMAQSGRIHDAQKASIV